MPRLWSAVTPQRASASAVQPQAKGGLEVQPQVRGASESQRQDRVVLEPSAQGKNSCEAETAVQIALKGVGGTDCAGDVVRASGGYGAAVSKVEPALVQQGGSQAVSQVQAPAAAVIKEQQTNADDVPAIARQDVNTVATNAAATSNTAEQHDHQSVQTSAQAPVVWPDGETTQHARPLGYTASILHQAGTLEQSHSHSQSQPDTAAERYQDADLAAVKDDGYISLETGQLSAEQKPLVNVQGAKQPVGTASLFGAAESSDSQGSLPEIDSGDSSDSSSIE